MKNIIYLNNYLDESIIHQRNNANVFSQAANNKISGIRTALEKVGCDVTIVSSGLTNGKSARWFRRKIWRADKMIYCGIFDFPLLNTLSSIVSMYREIRRLEKQKPIDHIIFYNYKPEVAWPAYWAKKYMGIPITIEYEDGYSHIDNMKSIKSMIFSFTEKYISKRVDSAIVVNSAICKQYSVPSVVVRGIVNEKLYQQALIRHKTEHRDRIVFAYTGGIDNERGIDILIEALKYVKDDIQVIVTGKGKLNCIDARLQFKGMVPYDEMQEILLSSDILLQCQKSRSGFAQVSFPSKLFEYLATQNLIISSDIQDVKCFAGDALLYYENDDPRKLAKAMEKAISLIGDTDVQQRLNDLARENLPQSVGTKILQSIF